MSMTIKPEVVTKDQYARKCKHNHTLMVQKVTLSALHFRLYNLLGLQLCYPYNMWLLLRVSPCKITRDISITRMKRHRYTMSKTLPTVLTHRQKYSSEHLEIIYLYEWGHILSCGNSERAMTAAATGPLKITEQHWLSPAAVLGQLVQFSGQV